MGVRDLDIPGTPRPDDLNIGAGQQTRLTMIASAPAVLNQAGRSPSPTPPPYETISLSAFVSTTTFAALLRVRALDSNPTAFGPPGVRLYANSADTTGDVVAKVIASPVSQPRSETMIIGVTSQMIVYQAETASDFSMDLLIHLVGFWDTIGGVGTQRVSGLITSIAVSTTSAVVQVLSTGNFAAAANRMQVFYLETSGSNNVSAGSTYDIEFYTTASGASNQYTSVLLFQAVGVDASAAYVTRLPFFLEDTNSSGQLFLRLSNQGTQSGLWSLLLRGEKYA